MKLVRDEKLKHRLIGLAVILSLGAIFAPAIMKKSTMRTENNFSVHVELPPKPIAPNIVIQDKDELFKTIKVAKVELATENESQLPELVSAQPLSTSAPYAGGERMNSKPTTLAATQAAKQVVTLAMRPAPKPVHKSTVAHASQVGHKLGQKTLAQLANRALPRTLAEQKKRYTVQLASFNQKNNAQSLVNKLRNKGFVANFTQIPGKKGSVYKVYAGNAPNRSDALKLKAQIASLMQLKGFVIATGVS